MRFILTLIILIPLYAYAQSEVEYECVCDTIYSQISDEIDSLKAVISSDTIQDKRYLACCYHCLGVKYQRRRKYVDANYQYEKSIGIRRENNFSGLGKSSRNLGYSYKQLGLYHKAIFWINEAMRTDAKEKERLNSHVYLGSSYTSIGEFEKAEQSLSTAFQLAKSYEDTAKVNNTRCILYTVNESFQKAIEHGEKATVLYEKAHSEAIDSKVIRDIKRVFKDRAKAYNNLGNAYIKLGKNDEAINSYNFSVEVYQERRDTSSEAQTLNNIAAALYGQKKYKRAIRVLNKSLQLKKKYYSNDSFRYTYAANYENLAENYQALGNVEKALEYCQLALQNLTDNFRNQDVNTNPEASDNHHIYNKPDLLRVLDFKGQAAMKSGKIDLAYHTYIDIDNWINEFYKDLSTKESKLAWIERAHDTYAHAIEVALAKKDKEKAFEYAEKAHAVLLWQSLSQKAARSLLSKNDKEKIDRLTAKIRQAERQYDDGQIKIDFLRNLQYEREALEKTLEGQISDYAKRKYQPEATTVSEIQSKIIDNQTVFIEYYRTDDILYIFTITKNRLEITQRKADGLAEDINDFVENVSLKDMNLKTYYASAYKLYEQLIPSSIRSNNDINSLVIVPDREIGKLPFAALTTELSSGKLDKNTPFLVKKYTTNYLYSAGSYLQLQKKKADQPYCFAGIAPIEYQSDDWKELPNAKLDEMKSLHWWWQREILTKETATKAAFERIINGKYRTIQVNTHALFDKNKGQIVFYDSVLNQDEIDELKINTHRLILSACETGVGVQNQGEGILSLGWNFAYKGVPSITMTHWKIDDYSSQKIMVNYHENLNDGTAADHALKDAQLSYLNSNDITSNSEYSPYYWAAFFHTGNTE